MSDKSEELWYEQERNLELHSQVIRKTDKCLVIDNEPSAKIENELRRSGALITQNELNEYKFKLEMQDKEIDLLKLNKSEIEKRNIELNY